jgi:hypothetical protein
MSLAELQTAEDLRYHPFQDLMENSKAVTHDMAQSYGFLNNNLLNVKNAQLIIFFFFTNFLIYFISSKKTVGGFTRLYEPILERCTKALDNRVDSTLRTLVPIKNRLVEHSRDIIYKTKARLLLWSFCDKTNLYNTFVSQWLVVHMPFTSTALVSFEDFSKRFDHLRRGNRHPQLNDSLKNFYGAAQNVWRTMRQPNIEEIKQAVLEIVARTINKNLGKSDESFGNSIYHIFCTLVNNKNELVSEQTYISMVRSKYQQQTGLEAFDQTLSRSALEYYDFAKRFILLDFPLARIENGIFHAWYIFLHDRTHRISNAAKKVVSGVGYIKSSVNIRSKSYASKFLRHCEEQMELLHHHLLAANENRSLGLDGANETPRDEGTTSDKGLVVLQFRPRLEVLFEHVNAITGILAKNSLDYVKSTRVAAILSRISRKLRIYEGVTTGAIAVEVASERTLNHIVRPALLSARTAFRLSKRFACLQVQNMKSAFHKEEFKNAIRTRYSYLKHSLISIRNMTMEIKIEREVFEKNFKKIAEDLRDLLVFLKRFENGFGLSDNGRKLYKFAVEKLKSARNTTRSAVESFAEEVLARKVAVLGASYAAAEAQNEEEEEKFDGQGENQLLKQAFREENKDFMDVDKLLQEVRQAKLETFKEQKQTESLHNEISEILFEESALNDTVEKIQDHHDTTKYEDLSKIEESKLEDSKLDASRLDESKVDEDKVYNHQDVSIEEKVDEEPSHIQAEENPLEIDHADQASEGNNSQDQANSDSDHDDQKPKGNADADIDENDDEGYQADSNEDANNGGIKPEEEEEYQAEK